MAGLARFTFHCISHLAPLALILSPPCLLLITLYASLDPMQRRAEIKAKIFFGYTSNLISSGTREVIRYLAEHKMVDVIVSTAGGIEEDLIKCLAPTYVGDFKLDGATLRKQGRNRIGNMLVPNSNYCLFEDWFVARHPPMFNSHLSTVCKCVRIHYNSVQVSITSV